MKSVVVVPHPDQPRVKVARLGLGDRQPVGTYRGVIEVVDAGTRKAYVWVGDEGRQKYVGHTTIRSLRALIAAHDRLLAKRKARR